MKIAPIIRERLITLDDAIDMAGFFFKEFPIIDVEQLIGKDMSREESAMVVEKTLNVFRKLPVLEKELTEPEMREVIEKEGWSAGQAFGILRMAITGQKVSPPLFESIEIIGKDVVMERLESALNILKGSS